jgi:chemotaxis protein CheD
MPGSSQISTSSGQRLVVGVGDVASSNNPNATLSTYALGSCIGVVGYDPLLRVGGMLHLMLPHSSIAPAKATTQPAMFADTGLPLFFSGMYNLKAAQERLIIYVIGGASILGGKDAFKVGEKNFAATMQYFTENRIGVSRSLVGGTINRTLHLAIGSGILTLKIPGRVETLPLVR